MLTSLLTFSLLRISAVIWEINSVSKRASSSGKAAFPSSAWGLLDEEGIIVARHYQERPPRLAYQLTEPGRELASALRLLTAWGARHSPDADVPRHDLCGTALEARWHCPTCDRTLEGDDSASELRYL